MQRNRIEQTTVELNGMDRKEGGRIENMEWNRNEWTGKQNGLGQERIKRTFRG